MTRQEEVLLNQVAQHILPPESGQDWFAALPVNRQHDALRWLANMILQAGAKQEDVPEAIEQAGLKRTYTPCVLLSQGPLPVRLTKVVNLPASEYAKAYPLLMALLSIADARRRATQCAAGCSHWWHRDLSSAHNRENLRTTEVA